MNGLHGAVPGSSAGDPYRMADSVTLPSFDSLRGYRPDSPTASPCSNPGPRGRYIRRSIQAAVTGAAAGHAAEPVP